ncbi:transposase [Endozoicomonas acroporae]|uniref:transposase n=1 Tax=Endozoicomonas acroporae TaxID=1701104 RepID=UPI000C763E21
MPSYSKERKAAVVKKLLPPHNPSVPDVAREEGISEQTLYNWRKTLRDKGLPVPGNEHKSDQWSAPLSLNQLLEIAREPLSATGILPTRNWPKTTH